ncbi:MAG: T9SS type A sorting domain-containing protein [Calditrichaeota bacterium]|nr:T9SS type A sorting domain-containing protein [Calditrichota bacterium]
MKKLVFSALFILSFINNIFGQIYIATDGDDGNNGTNEQPYASFPKAISEVSPGDTIYVRGGVYNISTTIIINNSVSGQKDELITLTAFNDEVPVLDFSGLPSGDKGIKLESNYWHIKGLHITKAADNGMSIDSGSNNIIEQCQFYRNKDTGLQLNNGSSFNQIINCDSYYNADPPDYGDADGFAPKLSVGTGNYFYGCRAWGNCDDGWDGYLRGANDVSTTLENCWTWGNGYLENGENPGSKANGNGFKFGGGDNSNSEQLMHHMKLINCIAFNNKNKGFDQNNDVGSITLINCTGYNNLTANYRVQRVLNSGQYLIVKNCISLRGNAQFGSFAIQETNSWLSPFDATSNDFLNLDISYAPAPRMADGSLPEIELLHLAQGSDLIDSGVDLGYSFKGLAPDLGAFESDYTTSIENKGTPGSFYLSQNYPNPFNPGTTIRFSLVSAGMVNFSIFDVSGRRIETLINTWMGRGIHNVKFNAEHYPSGVYFYRIESQGYFETKKMIHVK